MSFPKPGTPVRGSRSGAPIMALFDLLSRRWAMGIVWQLSDGEATFRELQERCESVSPTVLNARIKELREAGMIHDVERGYALTRTGRRLYDLLVPMGKFAKTWAKQIEARENR
jgi:DNA-binding HxlR family transcriptional regulator